MPSFRLQVPALPESIREVRDAVADIAEQAGISNPWTVQICISEAITNAIVHAYKGGPEGHVDIATAVPQRGTLRVTVADRGIGFQRRAESTGLGLGLPLIAKLATRVDMHSGEYGGTVVFMEFDEDELRSRVALTN